MEHRFISATISIYKIMYQYDQNKSIDKKLSDEFDESNGEAINEARRLEEYIHEDETKYITDYTNAMGRLNDAVFDLPTNKDKKKEFREAAFEAMNAFEVLLQEMKSKLP